MRPYNVDPNPAAVRAAFAKGVAGRTVAANKPVEFNLGQNYPNPFNPSTEIRFAIPEDSHVQLTVYNSLGQEVQTLINQFALAGNHTVKLDAKDLASGVYFYRLQVGGYHAVRKMMLIR